MLKTKKQIEKKPMNSILKVSLAILVIATSFILVRSFKSLADTNEAVTTEVVIGNAAPEITAGPAESPATTSSTTINPPIAAGQTVTFSATAKDLNGQQYHLTICRTNSITPSGTVAGVCDSPANTLCSTSTKVNSETQASCTYTTKGTAPFDPFTNPWYAFVCDNDPIQPLCSTASQGTGDSGSPLVINHVPTFASISNSGNIDPGATITWTATANDPDLAVPTDGDYVKLLVCKTNSITNGACTGDTWCTSTEETTATFPVTCSYTAPSVEPDGARTAYVFIVDKYNVPAVGGAQGTTSNFNINNVTPTVSGVTINGGLPITLTESSTTPVAVTATVVDKNGCDTTEISTVKAYVYRGGASPATSLTSCISASPANADYCYNAINCTQNAGSCVAGTGSATYSCTANLQYYADPTDTITEFPTESWYSSVNATDNNTATHTATVSTGVDVNSLTAFSVGDFLNYGQFAPTGAHTNLTVELITTPTGNVGIDQKHHGTKMCPGYGSDTACTGVGKTPILPAQQHYHTVFETPYASGTPLDITGTAEASLPLVDLNVNKVRNGVVNTKSTWWGISIPEGTLAGTYNGLNTIIVLKSAVADWNK